MTTQPTASGSSGIKFRSFRAMSPMTSAMSFVDATAQEDASKASLARTQALGLAANLSEVVQTIPLDYRFLLNAELIKLRDYAQKCIAAKKANDKLESHKASGTWPNELAGVHAPVCQMTKEFISSASYSESPASNTERDLKGFVETFKKDCLDRMLKSKLAELQYYETLCSPEHYLLALRGKVIEHWNVHIAERSKIPVFPDVVMADDGVPAPVMATGFEVNPVMILIRDNVINSLPRICHVVLQLEFNKDLIEKSKLEAKKELKDRADVEMGDALNTESTTSLGADLAKQLSAIRKELSSLKSHDKSTGGDPHVHTQKVRSFSLHPDDNRPLKRARIGVLASSGQGQIGARQNREKSRQRSKGPIPSSWDSSLPRQQGRQCPSSRPSEGQEGLSEVQGQGERKGKGVNTQIPVDRLCILVSKIRSMSFDYNHPSTYPDDLLRVPAPTGIMLLLERVPLGVLEAARFRAHVFLGPDVHVPEHLQIHLSSSLRFLMNTKPDFSLITSAWDDLKDRLRWRLSACELNEELKDAFRRLNKYEPDDSDINSPYDPDYEVPHKRKPFEGELPQYFEDGLRAGDLYVKQYLDESPLKPDWKSPRLVWLTELKAYLEQHDYVVTQTDKNLGVSIVTRRWFIENARKLWDDESNYRKLDYLQVQDIALRMRTQIAQVASLAKKSHHEGGPEHEQLAKFLVSKLPEMDKATGELTEEPVLPKFYGIPKMHKQPVKMRPIVPCHSVMQAPLAIFCSKQLKPLVEAQPYVLKGSKDLAIKLDKLSLDKSKKAWIISGDIVAFYPNIPLQKCLRIVQGMARDFYKDESQVFRTMLNMALNICNQNLVIEFQGEYCEQIKGLAMGIACSPDLANLYGSYFENQILASNVELKQRLAFFGRYLDDVLGIVYADSRAEASRLAALIQYEDVELTWSVSEYNTPFLDMFVYLDPITGSIEHKPYRKPLNHRERIPWASNHPKDVKRATFIGEMSRLAVLSSKPEHYTEALIDLKNLYLARGYPQPLVRKWLTDNCTRRWQDRLVQKEKVTSPVIVLKTMFNPAWDSFNIHELSDSVVSKWRTSLVEFQREYTKSQTPRYVKPVLGPRVEVTVHSQITETVQTDLHRYWDPKATSSAANQGNEKRLSLEPPPGDDETDVRRGEVRDNVPPVMGQLAESTGAGFGIPTIGFNDLRDLREDDPALNPWDPRRRYWHFLDAWERPDGTIGTGELIKGSFGGAEAERVFNVERAHYTTARWLISRKRRRNLGDFINVWNNHLLNPTLSLDFPEAGIMDVNGGEIEVAMDADV